MTKGDSGLFFSHLFYIHCDTHYFVFFCLHVDSFCLVFILSSLLHPSTRLIIRSFLLLKANNLFILTRTGHSVLLSFSQSTLIIFFLLFILLLIICCRVWGGFFSFTFCSIADPHSRNRIPSFCSDFDFPPPASLFIFSCLWWPFHDVLSLLPRSSHGCLFSFCTFALFISHHLPPFTTHHIPSSTYTSPFIPD